MIQIPLKYGSAWVEDSPTWSAVSGFFAARCRALADLEHASDLVPETLRLFVTRWTLTDANARELVVPADVEGMYFEDTLTLSEAVKGILLDPGILTALSVRSSAG